LGGNEKQMRGLFIYGSDSDLVAQLPFLSLEKNWRKKSATETEALISCFGLAKRKGENYQTICMCVLCAYIKT